MSEFGNYAWYWDNSGKQTHPVGKKKPNAWGLYDMLGNVCEWCADWYDARYYQNSPTQDPQGARSGRFRVLRGGSWSSNQSHSRCAFRNRVNPGYPYDVIGFRGLLQVQ